ncbi:metalloendopeptidase [Thecaphora frezii]
MLCLRPRCVPSAPSLPCPVLCIASSRPDPLLISFAQSQVSPSKPMAQSRIVPAVTLSRWALARRSGVLLAGPSPAGPPSRVALPELVSGRTLHTSSPHYATYRRFGQPASAPPSQVPPSQQQRQDGPLPLGVALQGLLTRQAAGGRPGGFRRGRGGSKTPSTPLIVIVIGGASVYYVYHLEQVPETGRWRFMNVSGEQEIAMGLESYQQVLREHRDRILPHDHPYSRYVRKTAARIISALEHGSSTVVKLGSVDVALSPDHGSGRHRQTDWEVFVINDPDQKNAFVLPGGKIFVFTGILPICANEDGLATVLGHEMAHQVARHSAEKLSGLHVFVVAAAMLEAVVGLDAGLSRMALTLLLSLPNSRKMELEADRIGLDIMAKACYDPREASRLWQRMEASEGGSGGGLGDAAKALLSTHPVNSQRIRKMEEWLPDAMGTRSESGCPSLQDVGGFRSLVGSRSFSSAFG